MSQFENGQRPRSQSFFRTRNHPSREREHMSRFEGGSWVKNCSSLPKNYILFSEQKGGCDKLLTLSVIFSLPWTTLWLCVHFKVPSEASVNSFSSACVKCMCKLFSEGLFHFALLHLISHSWAVRFDLLQDGMMWEISHKFVISQML